MKSLPPNRPQEHFAPKNITPQKNRQKEKALIYQGFSCVSINDDVLGYVLLYHVGYGWCIGYSRKSKKFIFVDIIAFLKASQVE